MMVVCDTIVDWMAVLCGKLVERGDDWDMKAVGTNFQQEVVMLEDLEVVEI
jgi:stress response protein SCP2